MLDYDEELKKFSPCLDVENVEDVIQNQEITDIIDLLKAMESDRLKHDR